MNSNPNEIEQKYKTSETFRKEMKRADENYQAIRQHAQYSNLSSVNTKLISKFVHPKLSQETYFIYAIYMGEGKISMDLITGYFVSVFQKYFLEYLGLRNLMC